MDFSSFTEGSSNNQNEDHHLRSLQYKLKFNTLDQNERRRKRLEEQKLRRLDVFTLLRGIEEEEQTGLNEQVSVEKTSTKVTVPTSSKYKNQLMLSEWLVEIPTNFEKDWLFVFCPVGKRSLIIASRGSTRCYTKSGFCINSFPSFLPGGNKQQYSGYTILDCIYNESLKKYFVLDIMCWNSHPVYESDTEFRFYWKNTKLKETPEISCSSRINPYSFIDLPNFKCEKRNIQQILEGTSPFEVEVDGLLFYNKFSHYECGTTPLVGWLKPGMISEIFQEILVQDTEME